MSFITNVFNLGEANVVCNIPLVSTRQPDHLVWHFTNHGMYTVKSGYRVAFETSEV